MKILIENESTVNDVYSWQDWESRVLQLHNYPDSILVPVHDQWQEISTLNWHLFPHLQRLFVKTELSQQGNQTITIHNPTTYKILKYFFNLPVAKMDYFVHQKQTKHQNTELQNEMLYLFQHFTESSQSKLLLEELIKMLEKQYSLPKQLKEFTQIKNMLDSWVVNLLALSTDLPQHLRLRVNNLFHQVFESVLYD
jgi:hypothetical protein